MFSSHLPGSYHLSLLLQVRFHNAHLSTHDFRKCRNSVFGKACPIGLYKKTQLDCTRKLQAILSTIIQLVPSSSISHWPHLVWMISPTAPSQEVHEDTPSSSRSREAPIIADSDDDDTGPGTYKTGRSRQAPIIVGSNDDHTGPGTRQTVSVVPKRRGRPRTVINAPALPVSVFSKSWGAILVTQEFQAAPCPPRIPGQHSSRCGSFFSRRLCLTTHKPNRRTHTQPGGVSPVLS